MMVAMVVTARDVHAAVLVICMPPAIEVGAVRVAMHVTPVARPGNMELAVLVISMPPTVEVRAVWPAVNVTVMVTMPVIARLGVDFLGLVHNPIRGGTHRPQRCR